MPVIQALWLRQEDFEFKASLSYIARPYLNKTKINKHERAKGVYLRKKRKAQSPDTT
jgi:hypothetical protein